MIGNSPEKLRGRKVVKNKFTHNHPDTGIAYFEKVEVTERDPEDPSNVATIDQLHPVDKITGKPVEILQQGLEMPPGDEGTEEGEV